MEDFDLGDCADQDPSSPPYKRSRLAGAATYETKYNNSWSSVFPFIAEGQQDPVHSFFCKVCKKDISCSHQGITDVRRHEKSKVHVNNLCAVSRNSRLSDMGFVPVGSSIDKQVIS